MSVLNLDYYVMFAKAISNLVAESLRGCDGHIFITYKKTFKLPYKTFEISTLFHTQPLTRPIAGRFSSCGSIKGFARLDEAFGDSNELVWSPGENC